MGETMDSSDWSYLVTKVQKIEALVDSVCAAGIVLLLLNFIARWYPIDVRVIYGLAIVSGYLAHWDGRRRADKYWETRNRADR
jgi:hypothetical protein